MIIWHDIRALLTNWSQIQISPSPFYFIKIKHKVVWAYASFKPKRLSLEIVW
jgi:hypothetical protein